MRSPGAHPRSRGENLIWPWAIASRKGSSPLTRGKPDSSPQSPYGRRLIPAHAGKTSSRPSSHSSSAAHPRSRGENALLGTRSKRRRGSSPLTRGKREVVADVRQVPGLIPAHAGKTGLTGDRRGGGRAHPRSRGENLLKVGGAGSVGGSSPLTRGKPNTLAAFIELIGLIPAHAGKTLFITGHPAGEPAHPRSRGENLLRAAGRVVGDGSSPLTRGKLIQAVLSREFQRLIPAHAGKTVRHCASSSLGGAHPRSRGENPLRAHSTQHQGGSSPLTRGKLRRRRFRQ